MAPKTEACDECTQNCHLIHRKNRNPSPVATTFFKVMYGDEYSKALFLPPKFAHSVQQNAGKTTRLEDSCGEKWEVKYTKIGEFLAFEEGWNTFCLDHKLKVGDFLVFHYIMESHFVVSMYGESGCPEARHFGFNNHLVKDSRKEHKLTNVDHHIPSNAISNGHHHEIKNSDDSQQKETVIEKKRTDDDVMPLNLTTSNTHKNSVASSSRSQPSDSDKETSQRSKPLVNTNPDIDKMVCATFTNVENNKEDLEGGDLGVKSVNDVSIPKLSPEKPSGGKKDDVAVAAGGGRDGTKIKEPEKVLETSSKKMTEKPKEITNKSSVKKRLRNTFPVASRKIVKRESVLTSQTDISGSKSGTAGGSSKPIVTPPKITEKEPITSQEKDTSGPKPHNATLPHKDKPMETPKKKLTMNRDSVGAITSKTDIHNSNNDILLKVKPEPVDHDESPTDVSTNASFSAVMTSYKYLELPKWVKFKSKVVLLRNRLDLWPVLYQDKVGIKALTQSWEAFAKQRGIQVGDSCEFVLESEASSNSSCSVFIVHVTRKL